MQTIVKLASALLALSLAGAALIAPSTAQEDDEITILDLSLGFPYDEDFQADDGGWNTTEVPPPPPAVRPDPVSTWAWGAPTSGPGFAASGSNVWATNLAGDYDRDHCAGIMSPPVALSGTGSASLSFQSWLHSDASTFSGRANDAGIVFATTDGGDTLSIVDAGYNTDILNSITAKCLDGVGTGTPAFGGPAGTTPPPAVYGTITGDLTPLLGETVQLVIAFGSNCCTHRDGWYIDDFTVEVDGSTVFSTDFEVDDGGFEVVPVAAPVQPPFPKGWEWGEPTTGPGVDEGEQLWATQLHDDYGHLECSWIESPPFEVGPLPNEANAVVNARLSWSHWVRTNSIYASGVVQVGHDGGYTVLEPEGGYPATIGSTSSTFVEVTKWQTDCFGLEWEAGDSLHRGYSGTVASSGGHAIGEPLTDHFADLTDFVGEEITIRFLFASGWRDVNPTVYPGWYVDDLAVELRVKASVPSPESLIASLTGNAPGWTSGGPDNEWAWGAADSGLEYATNLGGEYSTPHCGYIESPAVSGATIAADPTLTIDHKYGMSQSGSFAWYGGFALASADGGPWTLVGFDDQGFSGSTASRSCVNTATGTQPPTGTPAFGGWQLDWHTSSTDLSAFAGADEVSFRFVMGGTSTAGTGCGESTPCDGWSIRGVNVGGQELLAVPDSLLPTLPV